MNSQIVWQLNGTNIEKTEQSSTKLFANGIASAEYILLSNDILKSDVVTIIANRSGDEFKYRLHYNNAIKLLDGTIVSGWYVISNGDELRVDLQTGTLNIAFNFDIKRYSLLDETSLIADYTTEQDIVTLYPSSRYVPQAETSDVEQILKDLNDLEIKHNEDISNINEQLALKETIAKHNEDIAEINTQLDLKQNINDDGLNTDDKTVVGAINEVKATTDENLTGLDTVKTDISNIQILLDNKVDRVFGSGNINNDSEKTELEQSLENGNNAKIGVYRRRIYIPAGSPDIARAEIVVRSGKNPSNSTELIITGTNATITKTTSIESEEKTELIVTGGEIATSEDIQKLENEIKDIKSINIRNINDENIYSTIDNVQNIANQYILDNYNREPKAYDALIITLTDKNNDKVLYIYSDTNNIWINSGINDIDLSNYVDKTSIQTISGDKDFTGALTKNGENVATETYVYDYINSLNATEVSY